MSYTFGIGVVTAAVAVNLREFSRRLDKSECAGMFIQGLVPIGSPVGTAPTRFISSGLIPQVYAQTINDPVLLYTRAKAQWEADGDVFPFTQLQVTNAWNNCVFTNGTTLVNSVRVDEGPFALMARLGLEPARVALP